MGESQGGLCELFPLEVESLFLGLLDLRSIRDWDSCGTVVILLLVSISLEGSLLKNRWALRFSMRTTTVKILVSGL